MADKEAMAMLAKKTTGDFRKLSVIQNTTEIQAPLTTRKAICSEHGEYTATAQNVLGRTVYTGCPKCIEGLDRIEAEKEAKISWLSKRRENMRLGNYQANTDKQRYILDRCRKYVDNFGRVFELGSCLVFVGNPGTGKTHLATGIAYDVMKAGFSVTYQRLYDLMIRIKSTYVKNAPENEATIIKSLSEYDLLVVDEVGLKGLTETEVALTYQLIDKRYENVKPTLLVSNLSQDDLEKSVGTRTIDRLYENHGVFLVFDWESNRRKRAS